MSLDFSRKDVAHQASRWSQRRSANRNGRGATLARCIQLRHEPLEQRALLSVTAVDLDDVLLVDSGVSNPGQDVASDFDGDTILAWSGGHDDVQRISFEGNPTGGTFRLDFEGRYEGDDTTTPDIAFVPGNNGAVTAQNILDALENNEVKLITFSPAPAGGGFTLGYRRLATDLVQTTAAIPFGVNDNGVGTAAGITNALAILDVEVVVTPLNPGTPGSPITVLEYEIEFVGDSANFDHEALTVVGSSLGPGAIDIEISTLNEGASYIVTPVVPFVPREPGTTLPPVTVTEYLVTFTGTKGFTDWNEMTVDDNSVTGATDINVETDLEAVDPIFDLFTNPNPDRNIYAKLFSRDGDVIRHDFLVNQLTSGYQTEPAVAMDADGDFVIVWTSASPDLEYGSTSDIFARRFNSLGEAIDSSGTPRPDIEEFRVNTYITNPQMTPTVGMDLNGAFVVAWANEGQSQSFFNHISAQRFDRFGQAQGAEIIVNVANTHPHRNPDIAVGRDGRFVVLFDTFDGSDINTGLIKGLQFAGYDAQGLQYLDQTIVDRSVAPPGNLGAIQGTIDMDSVGNFFVAYVGFAAELPDPDLIGFRSVYGRAYDAEGNLYSVVTGANFNAASSTSPFPHEFHVDNVPYGTAPQFDALRPDGFDGPALYFGSQFTPSISVDADGDFTIGYNGFGPDLDMGILPPVPSSLATFEYFTSPGDPNAALLSQFAASPLPGIEFEEFDTLYSDFVVNTNHDGVDDQWLLTIPEPDFPDTKIDGTEEYSGTFSIIISTPGGTQITEDITFLPENANEILVALSELDVTGIWDPEGPWTPLTVFGGGALPEIVYTINFQEALHDRRIEMAIWMSDATVTFENDTGEVNDDGTPVTESITIDAEIVLEREEELDDAFQANPNLFQGTTQANTIVEVQPDGDFITAWNEPDTGRIVYRRFNETTDTAGPVVTDILREDKTPLGDGAFVNDEVKTVSFVFDEAMTKSTVENVANWSLNRLDGAAPHQIFMGIESVTYGLNLLTNKWEAEIVFDGNGPLPGSPALGNGLYQIVATNALRDKSLNALARTGFNPTGLQSETTFRVQIPLGGETLVNEETTGDQSTAESPQTIARDADGDYVVVWTSDGQDGDGLGVFAQFYNADGTARISEFQVNTTTISDQDYPSVAMDADGDFIVTWTSFAADPETLWDIYAQRYDSAGNPIGGEFLVNTYTESIQRYSTVAMDNDGDFVITWQSYGQDESGYGIYAQRYAREGYRVGGADEVQLISIGGVPTGGTFNLEFDGNTTEDIEFTVEDDGAGTAENIRLALAPFAKVSVIPVIPFDSSAVGDPVTATDYRITFIEEFGSADQPEMTVAEDNITGSGISIEIDTATEGTTGEFLANQTTANNQMRPSVSAQADGEFVIAWEAAGQFGEALNLTNIVARRFASNDAIDDFKNIGRSEVAVGMTSSSFNATPLADTSATVETRIVTTGDPADYIVATGEGYDGVVALEFFGFEFCTGSLLQSGEHILTAGHCVVGFAPEDITIRFDLPTGPVRVGVSEIIVHPGYTDGFEGNDIAVLTLASAAPSAAERYDIYRGGDEVGKVSTKVGYGRHGTGAEGDTDSDNRKRVGQNIYDAPGEILVGTIYDFGQIPGTQLAFDFDNGQATNDFFGQVFGIANVGLGDDEVNSAPGDSGGPTFIDGLIAGVTSYGFGSSGFVPTDVDEFLNSSFGEASVDARVSSYAAFIDAITGGATGAFPLSPEFLVNETALLSEDNPNPLMTNQTRPDVAMDLDGDFVITWTSYGQESTDPAYGFVGEKGVFARRFDSDNIAVDHEFQVNTVTRHDQQNSRVAVEADGDFFIIWESFEDVDLASTTGDPSSFGVFAQRFMPSLPELSENDNHDKFGPPIRVNTTIEGDQRWAGVGSDHDGAVVYSWSGNGEQAGEVDSQGVFTQQIGALAKDAGPIVTDLIPVDNETIIVRFSEDLNISGLLEPESVTNVLNWALSRNDLEIDDAVATVEFGLDKAFELGLTSSELFKYEAVLTLAAPIQTNLEYLLTIQDFVEDVDGNRLDGDYSGQPGGDFNGVILIEAPEDGTGPGIIGKVGPEIDVTTTIIDNNNQRDSAVAVAAGGDFVVVWTSVVGADVLAQRYGADGNEIGSVFTINNITAGNQDLSQIVMADDGSFLVVWSGSGTGDASGIYGRTFNSDGTPQAGQFAINNTTSSVQANASVDMDANGDFVVAWSDYGYPGVGAVRARRFNSSGVGQGNDFLVTTNGITSPSVASDAAGNFVVTWAEFDVVTGFDIFAQMYDTSGVEVGVPLPVNSFKSGNQTGSKVAMDDDGNFVVVWNSFGQDGSGDGVYGQRFSPTGVKLGTEFAANTETFGDQNDVDIQMDGGGNFTLVWTGEFADDDGSGVLVRRYTLDGAPLGVEELVNATTTGDQFQPAVGANDLGQAVVSWTGDNVDPVINSTDIFAQRYNFGSATTGSVPTVMEVIVGGTTSTHADYSVPGGDGDQLRTIEVGGLNQIKIRFSEDVNVVQGDLSVVGSINGAHTFSDFSYDAASRTATWTVNGLSQSDELTLTLDDGVAAKVGGKSLDGNWSNPVDLADTGSSTFPSGNGLAGGDFVFNIRVLPGDANRDSVVDGLDYLVWAGNNNTIGGADFTDADFNGDGNVDGLDYLAWASNNGTSQATTLLAETIPSDADDFADLYINFANSYGSTVSPGTEGDLNGDGQVDSMDYLAILRHLNMSSSSVAPAPVVVSSYSQTPRAPLPVARSAAVVDQLIGDLDLNDDDNDGDNYGDGDWFDLHTDTIEELALSAVFDLGNE